MAAAPRTVHPGSTEPPAPAAASAPDGVEPAAQDELAVLRARLAALEATSKQAQIHVIKDSPQRVTDATAERQFVAAEVEKRNQAPLNVMRPGGYFLSSGAGIPTDSNGVVIPEAEWKPEDYERLKGEARPVAGELAKPHALGADVVESSGSEHRRPQPPR